jgi:RNA polymerase II subunit A C-terminal domain phosphatase SSU72
MAAEKRRVSFAMVCASNMNRSMEAHALLARKGFDVKSYGTSGQVKLPGPSLDKPNIYTFGTPYALILNDLKRKDAALYHRIGMIKLLTRNAKIKTAPERWQSESRHQFDVVIAFEDRVFDALVDHFMKRQSTHQRLVHIVNMPVKDTRDEAVVGAKHAHRLCHMIEARGIDWENSMERTIEDFIHHTGRRVIYMPAFY